MAKFLRSIYVNAVNATAKIQNVGQLGFFVDAVLSNPINKRYRATFEGNGILKIFDHMVKNLKVTDMVKVSNGTKALEFTVKVWREVITFNLSHYDSDSESKNRNVWIKVTGKTVEKNPTVLNTL